MALSDFELLNHLRLDIDAGIIGAQEIKLLFSGGFNWSLFTKKLEDLKRPNKGER